MHTCPPSGPGDAVLRVDRRVAPPSPKRPKAQDVDRECVDARACVQRTRQHVAVLCLRGSAPSAERRAESDSGRTFSNHRGRYRSAQYWLSHETMKPGIKTFIGVCGGPMACVCAHSTGGQRERPDEGSERRTHAVQDEGDADLLPELVACAVVDEPGYERKDGADEESLRTTTCQSQPRECRRGG